MELDRALEGIKHEEAIEEIEGLLKKLKRGRITEQAFWESRSEELAFHNIEDPLLSPSDTSLDDM